MLSLFSFLDIHTEVFFKGIRSENLTSIFKAITLLGNWQVVIVMALIISLWFFINSKKNEIISLWATLALTEFIVFFGKIIIHRARPLGGLIVEQHYSMPSGHAAIAMAFYGFCAIELCRIYETNKKKTFVILCTVVIVLLIGFSRLYLGVHYITDVVVGYTVGIASIFVIKKINRYFLQNSDKLALLDNIFIRAIIK